ncbi:MAG: 16S rRNA (guanine(527)-N(7))-methyltransferase RsmG [SAR86 cluster bacterium]|uniref:Ribosomal RNA small subunit methyltransferase G n=1 Tax=SAR86 cluster bacterium TaxID=2030880 RepID=A0A2A4X4I7_9GAMM|nr:MAG: 16S rRNA (guanine(527)-N(7))-methyltransferase RsmG [SAR86 cluster bacterium]
MTDSIREELQRGISSLSLNCNEEMLSSLLAYIDLLKKWNSAYNLLGGNELASLVSRHILDSLSVDPYLEGNLIVDIGAGAGLPGIPLAILNPEKNFVLIDSNGKKTRFMFQAKVQLGLNNISIENCRIEHYQSIQQIDMVMCRAFSTLADALTMLQPIFSSECKLLAMKGHYPEDEISRLPDGFELSKSIKIDVPGSESQRHLIEVMRKR